MTSISPISFRGSGSESAGSIAYRNNSPETTTNTETKVNFRGSGSETTGSIANKNNPPSIPTPITSDTVNFQGSGSETTGSVAHTDKSKECPSCGAPVNFKGSYNEDKKGVSTVGVLGGLVALTAATIIGLGYAHKKGTFKNLSDGWIKKVGEKIQPAAEKCHSWCTTVKKTGLEWWEKCRGFFSPKKD